MIDLKRAEKVREFIRNLSYSKGEWAGKAFELLPWQWEQIVKPLFSTLKPDGLRQYRTCYVEVPKKNGKTELGAALALYMLCADGEKAPEVYSAAADREQAGLIYQAASAMVRKNKVLSARLKVLDSRKRIINQKNNGFYQVLSSESYTKHGISPSAILFDEIHAQPNDELWTVLTSGTDYARAQQLIFVMTTAGIYDINSIWWKIRTKAIQVQAGIIKDPRFLPVLYLADPEKDDPNDEKLWERVNPSLGQIFTLDKIREDYESVKSDPVEFQNFLRFRLNIPIKQVMRWMPMQHWDKCAGPVDLCALRGKVCYGGLDMSTKIDLTAFILVFPPQEGIDKYIVVPRLYCPEETIMERSRQDRVHYEIWAQQGFLCATPGNVIDEDFIIKDVVQASKDYELRDVGFDPWGATSISNRLFNDHGILMTEVRQGAKSLSEPAKDILTKIMGGQVAHGGHPVLRWCADNLVMGHDANENIRPMKDKATDRIDGVVAMIIAWSRLLFTESTGPSVYERGGIEIV